MKTIKIVHIIDNLNNLGASLGTLIAAGYSQKNSIFKHSILSLSPPSMEALTKAHNYKIEVVYFSSNKDQNNYLQHADIVQVEWWNNPLINKFLCSDFPPVRLIIWVRVNSFSSGHYFPSAFIEIADHVMITTERTLYDGLFKTLPFDTRKKVSVMLAGADFKKLKPIQKKDNSTFTVGYIGSLSFVKMHRNYVSMSAAADIKSVKFLVFGTGRKTDIEKRKQQAIDHGLSHKFTFSGYIEAINVQLQKFDVFGYPLEKDTYAASEKSLQEAMYMGIPPIVFPHGGIPYLVKNNETGLIVHTEREYSEALEFLFHNNSIRKKLGYNAHIYAKNNLGIKNQIKKLHEVYFKVIKVSKNKKQLFFHSIVKSKKESLKGSDFFLLSIQPQEAAVFRESVEETLLEKQVAADIEILQAQPQLVFVLEKYKTYYPEDPYINFWLGIIYMRDYAYKKAVECFLFPCKRGPFFWRKQLYLFIALKNIGGEYYDNYFKTSFFPTIQSVIEFVENSGADFKQILENLLNRLNRKL